MSPSRSERRRRRRARAPRRGTHWTVYLGVALLAAGVLVLVIAAIVTR